MHIVAPREQSSGGQGGRKRIDKAERGWSVHPPIYCKRLILPQNTPHPIFLFWPDVNLRDVAVGVDDVHVGGYSDVDGGAARHACVPVRARVRPRNHTQVTVWHLQHWRFSKTKNEVKGAKYSTR